MKPEDEPSFAGSADQIVPKALGGKKAGANELPQDEAGDVIKLVDSQNNQYVLAKGKDSTVPHEDKQLIRDVIAVLIVATGCGMVCTLLQLPAMFGHIVSGILLGPSGINYLKSIVQLETLGEFGALFILFAVGLEFSPDKIRKVARVAVVTSCGLMVVMMCAGVACGRVAGIPAAASGFIGACLSLSSTPLVVKFLQTTTTGGGTGGGQTPATSALGTPIAGVVVNRKGSTPPDGAGGSVTPSSISPGDHGIVLLGTLIGQDVLLTVLVVSLPFLARNSPAADSGLGIYIYIVMRILFGVAVVFVACAVLTKWAIGPLYKLVLITKSRELLLGVSVSLALCVLKATDYFSLSMEVGAFLAGVMVSCQPSSGGHLAEEVNNTFSPVRDIFALLFFASIGLHVFPTFVAVELSVLASITITVVFAKFVISAGVLGALLPTHLLQYRWIISAGLAQISEFSFVLASRARQLGLISREVYLIILSLTTLSLLMAPVLWRISLWHYRLVDRSLPRKKETTYYWKA